jgi:nicotinamidase/pyrazinamidase
MSNALLIIDLQNDFCRKIPGGNDIVKPINQLISYAKKNNWLIIASRDWHSSELFSENPEKSHCLKNSPGAEYHKDLDTKSITYVISKGEFDIGEKHYSAFNGDQINLTDLLIKNNISELYIVGLATDYCVKNTAIDSVKNGFKTFVVIDACRGVNKTPDSETTAIEEMKNSGVIFLNTTEVLKQ